MHGTRLTPRLSFDMSQEEVRGRSLPWSRIETDAAVRLRLSIVDLVPSRAAELAEINVRLARSNEELDAFAYLAGHDLKEPLRAIHRNACCLMEEGSSGLPLSADATARLDAVLRLTVRMDNLLDALLHMAQVGRLSLDLEDTPIAAVLVEALEIMGARLIDSGVEIRVPQPLPSMRCNRIRVREVLSNLITNAVKYNDKTDPWVEIGYIDAQNLEQAVARPLSAPADTTGQTIFYVRDNGIGIESRHGERFLPSSSACTPAMRSEAAMAPGWQSLAGSSSSTAAGSGSIPSPAPAAPFTLPWPASIRAMVAVSPDRQVRLWRASHEERRQGGHSQDIDRRRQSA